MKDYGKKGATRLSLVAGLGLALVLSAQSAAFADDAANLTGRSARSSDQPPSAQESGPGYGDDNPTSTVYDTNWIFAAAAGDPNTIWFRVTGACIQGTGNVTTDDDDSIYRLSKRAWGGESVTFAAPVSDGECATITVTNRISIVAIWTIAANGANSMVLESTGHDILGGQHTIHVVRQVSGPTQVTNTSSFHIGGSGSATSTANLSSDSAGASTSQQSASQFGLGGGQTVTSSSGAADGGTATLNVTVAKSFSGNEATVFFSSQEMMDLAVRALVDDQETMVNVSRLDVGNVVYATYVVDSGSGNPQTPGGSPEGGPSTGGGGGGGGGPRTPSGDGSGGGNLPPAEPTPLPEPLPGDEPVPTPGTKEPGLVPGDEPVTPPNPGGTLNGGTLGTGTGTGSLPRPHAAAA